MTDVLKAAIEKLKKLKTGNVAYALVGKSLVGHESAYCFGSMSNAYDNAEDVAGYLEDNSDELYLELVSGVQLLDVILPHPGGYHTMILRATNQGEGSYREPARGEELEAFLRCQKMFLEQFEYALHPASFEERRENGIIIDLTKITSNALGVLLVGHRNLYEHRRYETIIPLMDDHGWGFQEAFTVSQFFRRMKFQDGVKWRGDPGGHCILNGAVASNHPDQISCMLSSNLLFTFTGEPYSDTAKWWGVQIAYSTLLQDNKLQVLPKAPGTVHGQQYHGHWPVDRAGSGFSRTEYLFTGAYPKEIAQFKGILKENK